MVSTANSTTASSKVIIEWRSPGRPYKERTREFYTTVLSIVFLLGVILLLLKEFLLIGVIIAFAFLSHILSSYKPDDVTHEITEQGVRTDGKLYPWETFINFWLKKQYGHEIIFIATKARLPGSVIMLIDPAKRDEIIKALSTKIPLVEYQDGFVDKAGKWLGRQVPLENT